MAPPKGGVIVAVIDDAIGFANERFRKGGRGDKTRFDYVWLQGVRGGPAKSDLPFGRELDATEINGLLTDFLRGGLVDEAGLYREIGYIDFLQSSVQSAASAASHGTAVTDRAGGDGAGGLDGPKLTDVDEMIVLMGVCLPSQVIGDTAGTFIEQYIILALERIQQRVRWLEAAAGRRYPLVVNLSFALTAGAQHRRGLLDSYLRVAAARHHADLPAAQRMPLVVVGPAGNHRLTKSHAVVPGPGAHPPLFWHLLPDDRTPSFIEVWSAPHPKVPAPTIHCALRPPGVAGPLPIPPASPSATPSSSRAAARSTRRRTTPGIRRTRPIPAGRAASASSSRPTRPPPTGPDSRSRPAATGGSRSSAPPHRWTCASSATTASPATASAAASPTWWTRPTPTTTRPAGRSRRTMDRAW